MKTALYYIAGMGWRSVSLVPKELSVIERSLYYRGRNWMEFASFGTKRAVPTREMSILWRQELDEVWYLWDQ